MPEIKDIIVKKPSQEEIETCSKWPTWSCEPSEFEWEYTQRETCLIIEGEVTVWSTDKSDSVSFGEGDLVILPCDLQCIWEVKKAVKKYYDFD